MSTWRSLGRVTSERPPVLDSVVAIAFTALLQVDVWTSHGDGATFEMRPLSSVLMLLLTVPLLWRRRAPLGAAAANGIGRAAQAIVTGTWVATPGILFSSIVALYSVGAYAERPRAYWGLCFVLGGLLIATAYDLPSDELDFWNGAFFYLLMVLVFGAGLYARSRRTAVELALHADRLERERAAQVQAVAEERARIARELHDVIAHNVSATVVQAEAAEEVLAHSPERARQSLVRIQHAGREALGEMRRLLGIMRSDGGDAGLEPQPRVAEIERLVEDSLADGVVVTLEFIGEQRAIPPGVELSAYRIVQEALTNVRKHAGRPSTATVVVRYLPAALELEVTDDGQGPTPGDGLGHGLIGMRERVAFFGGEFSATAGPQGGFVVRARLPLPAVEP